jgi:hypothetical protein
VATRLLALARGYHTTAGLAGLYARTERSPRISRQGTYIRLLGRGPLRWLLIATAVLAVSSVAPAAAFGSSGPLGGSGPSAAAASATHLIPAISSRLHHLVAKHPRHLIRTTERAAVHATRAAGQRAVATTRTVASLPVAGRQRPVPRGPATPVATSRHAVRLPTPVSRRRRDPIRRLLASGLSTVAGSVLKLESRMAAVQQDAAGLVASVGSRFRAATTSLGADGLSAWVPSPQFAQSTVRPTVYTPSVERASRHEATTSTTPVLPAPPRVAQASEAGSASAGVQSSPHVVAGVPAGYSPFPFVPGAGGQGVAHGGGWTPALLTLFMLVLPAARRRILLPASPASPAFLKSPLERPG